MGYMQHSILIVACIVWVSYDQLKSCLEFEGMKNKDAREAAMETAFGEFFECPSFLPPAARPPCSGTPPLSTVRAGPNGAPLYNFGRWTKPVLSMAFPELRRVQRLAQAKQFVWTSVTDGEWLVSSAVLDFTYNAGLALSVYNPTARISYARQIELPLVLNTFFGPEWVPSPPQGFASDGGGDAASPSAVHGDASVGVARGCVVFGPFLFDGTTVSKCFDVQRGAYVVNVTTVLYDVASGAKTPSQGDSLRVRI